MSKNYENEVKVFAKLTAIDRGRDYRIDSERDDQRYVINKSVDSVKAFETENEGFFTEKIQEINQKQNIRTRKIERPMLKTIRSGMSHNNKKYSKLGLNMIKKILIEKQKEAQQMLQAETKKQIEAKNNEMSGSLGAIHEVNLNKEVKNEGNPQ